MKRKRKIWTHDVVGRIPQGNLSAQVYANFQSLHCIAHLDRDISRVLPYLNGALGGETYTETPPSVMFKVYGKLITVHSRSIAINALEKEGEADRILEWLRKQLNEVWENRDRIKPSVQTSLKPRILEILKLLPRTNCSRCGQKTCMVFAVLVADGAKEAKDCPELSRADGIRLRSYIEEFT
jgi:ArsR family metal-binding transcriptional regulator